MPKLTKTYTILSAVLLAAIFGLGFMSLRYNQAFRNSTHWIQHTLSVLEETQKALTGLHNLETGQDGIQVLPHVQALRQLTADNPVQQARIDSMLAYSAKMNMVSRPGTPIPRPGSVNGLAPVYYPDSIRESLLRMQTEEHRLLALREYANSISRQLLSRAIIALLVLVFSLLCASFALVLYHSKRQIKTEKRLRESEHQFSLLVQREKNYSIFMVDNEGRVASWNEGAHQIKGYTESEVLGRHISLFYTQEEIDNDEPARNLRNAAEAGTFESVGWRRRKDGSLFWADVMFTAVYGEDGQVTGYIKITRDISEQRRAEEEIKQLLSREMELNEMKSRFVSLASHEFKTPLSVILSSVSLIDKYDGPDMGDQRRRHVQRIKSNVNNLKHILNAFLSLEKLEGGAVLNNPVITDPLNLATDIIGDLEESQKEGQQIRLEVNGDPRPLSVDQQMLRNVLNNLLSNAIKYSPEGALVRFIVEFNSDTISFLIIDNGIGIPLEEQEHLFERFFRAANTTGISGTGLGLSIVKKYLNLMGGSILINSYPGEGSTFTATIPAVPVTDAQQKPARNDAGSTLY